MPTILSTYDTESIDMGSLTSQVRQINRRAKELRAKARRARGQRVAVARSAVKLVSAANRQGAFDDLAGMGAWEWLSALNPVNIVSDLADKATELVTGVSQEQIEATEKQAAWAAQAIAERQAAGTITNDEAAKLNQINNESLTEAKQAASVTQVLTDTAKEAAATANSALGDPIGIVKKYGTYAAVGAGALVALKLLKVF